MSRFGSVRLALSPVCFEDMPFGAVLFGAACGSGGVGLRFGSVWERAVRYDTR